MIFEGITKCKINLERVRVRASSLVTGAGRCCVLLYIMLKTGKVQKIKCTQSY